MTLPPAPDSARQARRFVSDVLTTAGVDAERRDTAVLLTSELVTNGIVHALTDLQLTVEATETWVRVEVLDGNPNLPQRRDYDDEAMTGRGLEMLELLADEVGMQPLADDGKRVWFRLGASPGEPESVPVVQPAAVVTSVVLRNVPVALYCAWQQHASAILREALIAELDDRPAGVPDDLAMANDAMSALSRGTSEAFALRDAGVLHADITLSLPSASVPHFPVMRDVLRRCSAMSLVGQLLVPPALPEIQAVRNWVAGEVMRQATGLPPSPYVEQPDDHFILDEIEPTTLESVRAAATGMLAADRSNRIVAVSRAAAEVVGWEPEELEGHRLVSVIPPELRDAHVAGFTRYLLDGTTTYFGRWLDMPALHRDGSVVPIRMFVSRAVDEAGREYFIANVERA
ncbi:MAG: PAS domain S-box protein [Frankiaceae bacterium]|nr:PAS domain S-box protein [Frankiaceae bacterium]MBV9368773.1 PAS domain S-box protein [Frankiales bacterium]